MIFTLGQGKYILAVLADVLVLINRIDRIDVFDAVCLKDLEDWKTLKSSGS